MVLKRSPESPLLWHTRHRAGSFSVQGMSSVFWSGEVRMHLSTTLGALFLQKAVENVPCGVKGVNHPTELWWSLWYSVGSGSRTWVNDSYSEALSLQKLACLGFHLAWDPPSFPSLWSFLLELECLSSACIWENRLTWFYIVMTREEFASGQVVSWASPISCLDICSWNWIFRH